MFFSYTMSVILLSLAMFGLYRLVQDWWEWLMALRQSKVPSVTFLVIVKNQDELIEQLIRRLMAEIASMDISCEVIVVDWGSTDLTPLILARMIDENPVLTLLCAAEEMRPASEALPLCRGEVIHVFDLVCRMDPQEFLGIGLGLLKYHAASLRSF